MSSSGPVAGSLEAKLRELQAELHRVERKRDILKGFGYFRPQRLSDLYTVAQAVADDSSVATAQICEVLGLSRRFILPRQGAPMNKTPQDVRLLLDGFSTEFRWSVWRRFLYLLLATIVVRGRRTVWRLLQYCRACAKRHFSSYHRVFSHRRWSGLRLSRRLTRAVVDRLIPYGVLQLVGDDTVSQHRGEHVYGKGCHRDAVRSSHGHLVHHWGHKWIVLALRVRIPGTRRTWALPVLVALYRTPEESRRLGIRHKTPAELMQGLLCVWLRWFPQRIAVFSGDGAFAIHRLSQFAARYLDHFALVGKLVPDAVLHERPPARRKGQTGRPRIVGKRLPSPEQAVAQSSKRTRHRVSWYGGGSRLVEVVTNRHHLKGRCITSRPCKPLLQRLTRPSLVPTIQVVGN